MIVDAPILIRFSMFWIKGECRKHLCDREAIISEHTLDGSVNFEDAPNPGGESRFGMPRVVCICLENDGNGKSSKIQCQSGLHGDKRL